MLSAQRALTHVSLEHLVLLQLGFLKLDQSAESNARFVGSESIQCSTSGLYLRVYLGGAMWSRNGWESNISFSLFRVIDIQGKTLQNQVIA